MTDELKRLVARWRLDQFLCRGDRFTEAAGVFRRCADELETVLEQNSGTSAEHRVCKLCKHAVNPSTPTYIPGAWCYMFTNGSHVDQQGYCGQFHRKETDIESAKQAALLKQVFSTPAVGSDAAPQDRPAVMPVGQSVAEWLDKFIEETIKEEA